MLIGGTLFNLLLLRQCPPASIFIWSPLVYLMIWKMKQKKRSECRIRRGPGSFELIVQWKELSGKKKNNLKGYGRMADGHGETQCGARIKNKFVKSWWNLGGITRNWWTRTAAVGLTATRHQPDLNEFLLTLRLEGGWSANHTNDQNSILSW